MGVAVPRAADGGVETGGNRAMLDAAGYVLLPELSVWQHPALDRALHAEIAEIITAEQLRAWIAAGRQ